MDDQQSPPLSWRLGHRSLLGANDEDKQARGFEGAPAEGVRDLWGLLYRNLPALIGWVLVCMVGAGVYLYRATPEFVAAAQVVLEARRATSGVPDLAQANEGAMLDSAQADSQVLVVKSERGLRYVFDTLDLVNDPTFASRSPTLVDLLLSGVSGKASTTKPSAADAAATRSAHAFQAFADRISVRRLGLSYVLEISFRAPSAKVAARLANAVTASYIRDSIAYTAAAAQRGAEILEGRIAAIHTEQDLAAEAVRKGTLPDAAFPDSDIRVISGALEPLGSAYPRYKLIMILAATFGVLSGAGTLVARRALDRKVRTRRQIGQLVGVDRVCVIPRFGRRVRKSLNPQQFLCDANDTSPFVEAMRVLRTAVLASRKSSRQMSIGVVSWAPGEGRSVVAGNLAMLMDASQQPAILIDADFRNPVLSRSLAPDAVSGLDEALLRQSANFDELAVALGETLAFVPAVAGCNDSNPNVYLGSAEMAGFLRMVSEERSVVLDLPPLSVSAETQAIADLLDGVILVVEANRTSFEEMNEAFLTLRHAGVAVLRVVLNKAPLSEWLGSKAEDRA